MYCTTNPNHIFAAPNKYYEAMLLGKPIITTKGTIVGNKVLNYDIGFVIDETIESFKNLLDSLNNEIISQKGIKAKALWDKKFSKYTQDFLNSTYHEYIE